jgi:hypothetical protein
MVRPRWHDALIVAAITALFVVGIWSLWGDDVRAILRPDGDGGHAAPSASPAQT